MRLDEVGLEAEKKMVDIVFPKSADMLRGITNFDRAVFGCTSASAVYGRAGLERLERTMSDIFGCPAISAFGAVLREIRRCGAKKTALITPYTDRVNRFMKESLLEFGIETSYCDGLGIADDTQIAKVSLAELKTFVMERAEEIKRSSDVLLLSCTNLRSMEICDSLQSSLAITVVTSNRSICSWITDCS